MCRLGKDGLEVTCSPQALHTAITLDVIVNWDLEMVELDVNLE